MLDFFCLFFKKKIKLKALDERKISVCIDNSEDERDKKMHVVDKASGQKCLKKWPFYCDPSEKIFKFSDK